MLLEEGILFEVDFAEELQKADKKIKDRKPEKRSEIRFESMQFMLKDLRRLEVLRTEWEGNLSCLEAELYGEGRSSYEKNAWKISAST